VLETKNEASVLFYPPPPPFQWTKQAKKKKKEQKSYDDDEYSIVAPKRVSYEAKHKSNNKADEKRRYSPRE